MRNVLFATLALLAFLIAGFAQTSTSGAIVGTVTDSSGAVIPKADVQLVNTDTSVTLNGSTNEGGQFTFPNLPPGSAYRISVKMAGFRTATLQAVSVEVNRTATLDINLEVGAENQVVEVSAANTALLQTQDAQIGNSISTDQIAKLPTLQRNVTELMNLQPGVVPTGQALGFRTTGAIDDQNTVTLDGVDITQVVVAGNTSVPTPADSVEEFRANVANPNATLDRASGGQITLVGRHGSNTLHAAGYGYFQNSVLNSNTWDNNTARVAKPNIDDKRYGFRAGGPIKKDKTFLFANYEARNFDAVAQLQRTVPTDTLKQGILRFPDSTGRIVSYDLKTATVCGPNGNLPCDPRGLGISPSSKAQLGLMPASNLNSGGDGFNTLSYLANIPTPIEDRYVVGRLDHIFSPRFTFNGSYTYFRRLQNYTLGSAGDISLIGTPQSVLLNPQRGTLATASITQQWKPTLLNITRFGFTRDVAPSGALSPADAARLLNIPGASTSAGNIALLLGGGTTAFLDSPIDQDTQRARFQASYNRSYQIYDDLTWIKGAHTFSVGGQFQAIPYRHDRADKVVGSLSSLVALADQGSFLQIPTINAPPTCGAAFTTNCLPASQVGNWNRFYAAVLGLVDNVGVLGVRDATLTPTPLGTNLINRTLSYANYFYGQDTWRITKSLTLYVGLSYGFQTAPSEQKGQQTVQIDLTTGKLVDPIAYLKQKETAAIQGQIYNPNFGWVPVKQAHTDVFSVDYGNVAPRASFAWNPGGDGWLGRIMGDRKTVIRGGYALIYDRSNLVQNVLIPMLGVGFGQNISVNGPLCTASGSPGRGCDTSVGTANPGLSAFRLGVDGSIPLPAFPATTVPVVPQNFAETLSFQVDPNSKNGRSHSVDLSIQRELPGNWLVDVAYVGRFGRHLAQAVNLTQSPYMFKDSASGQTFAQAYDAIRLSLRSGTPAAGIPAQPWFENQLKGIAALRGTATATAFVVNQNASNFSNGNVSNIFLNLGVARRALGLLPYNNDQSQMEFMRTYIGETNYNGLLLSVTKRYSRGLLVNLNYTFSRALDTDLSNQNNASFYPNSFHPGTEYGYSNFDRKHVFNANFVYDLPAGKGHKLSAGAFGNQIIGGWYISGIATLLSGVPLIVLDSSSSQSWGDATVLGAASGAIPLNLPSTGLRPPVRGTGFNLFTQGNAAINNFRTLRISEDTRAGRANPLRGLPLKNFDFSIGKNNHFTIHDREFTTRFTADMFNVFNHPNFANPTQSNLSLANPNNFGVVNSTFVPANRTSSARFIQLAIRVEF